MSFISVSPSAHLPLQKLQVRVANKCNLAVARISFGILLQVREEIVEEQRMCVIFTPDSQCRQRRFTWHLS